MGPQVGGGKQRVLYRNSHLPCNALPFETPSSSREQGTKLFSLLYSAVPPNHVREDGESSDEEYSVSTHAPSSGQRLHRDQEDDDKEAEAYPTAQCDTESGDKTQPPTVIPQDMAAEPVKSGPEGPVLRDAQLDTESNGNLQCPDAEPLRDPTETVNAAPESPASASGETQEDSLRPKRERDGHNLLLLTVR